MSNIDIRIDIKKLMKYTATLRRTIDHETSLMIIKSFSKYVMNLYGVLIEEAANSNRYKGQWEPVSDEGYEEYLGTKPTGDILYYIKDALELKKLGNYFIIRINDKMKYPGSKLTIRRVVLAIDNGTSDFHARPILKSIIRKIHSHILDLFRGFLIMKGVI